MRLTEKQRRAVVALARHPYGTQAVLRVRHDQNNTIEIDRSRELTLEHVTLDGVTTATVHALNTRGVIVTHMTLDSFSEYTLSDDARSSDWLRALLLADEIT